MKEQVLVTGAAGFIGSYLIEVLLKGGYDVIALDKNEEALFKMPTFLGEQSNELRKIIADICDQVIMDKLGRTLKFDSIIHLAALATPRIAETLPDKTFRVNVLGTYNVLKMAKETGVKRVVFASTAHVYGISPKFFPTPENTPMQLQDTYTTSKILGEQLCQLFYENHNIPYVTFRMFNGYGPRQSLDYFIPAMINKAKNGEIILKGAKTTKDWVFVDDVVDAMIRGLETNYIGALNVGTGIQTSLETIAKKIAEHYGAKFSVDIEQPPPTFMQADTSRIKTILDWSPKTTLEEGLRKTLE